MSDHASKIKDIIEKELGVEREKLTPEASFIEDLGADSLAVSYTHLTLPTKRIV